MKATKVFLVSDLIEFSRSQNIKTAASRRRHLTEIISCLISPWLAGKRLSMFRITSLRVSYTIPRERLPKRLAVMLSSEEEENEDESPLCQTLTRLCSPGSHTEVHSFLVGISRSSGSYYIFCTLSMLRFSYLSNLCMPSSNACLCKVRTYNHFFSYFAPFCNRFLLLNRTYVVDDQVRFSLDLVFLLIFLLMRLSLLREMFHQL